MVKYATRVAGIYRARYVGTTDKKLTDQETGDEVTRWLHVFQEVDDSTTVGEISKFTGTDPKSGNSNAHKMLSGIMGRKLQDGDDTDSMIGRLYDVVWGPNQAGNLTITQVVLVAEGPALAVVPPAPAEATQEPATPEVAPEPATVISDDPLPF